MRKRSGIAVDHPNQSAVIGDHQVGILVPEQEARQMPQSILHLPVNHHAALPSEITGENDVRLPLGNRSSSLEKKRSDRKASRALVGRVLVLVAGWIVKFLASGMDEHRI